MPYKGFKKPFQGIIKALKTLFKWLYKSFKRNKPFNGPKDILLKASLGIQGILGILWNPSTKRVSKAS
jgi:hypothetical protein